MRNRSSGTKLRFVIELPHSHQILCHFYLDVNLCYQCLYIGGTLCKQLLLQFYTVLFETLHTLMPWPEDMNVLKIKFSDSVYSSVLCT